MYSSISVVTFRVSMSGAFGSTSHGEDIAREALAAILTAYHSRSQWHWLYIMRGLCW
jgi:hypothetical protein